MKTKVWVEVGVEVSNEVVGAGVLAVPEQPVAMIAHPIKTKRNRNWIAICTLPPVRSRYAGESNRQVT